MMMGKSLTEPKRTVTLRIERDVKLYPEEIKGLKKTLKEGDTQPFDEEASFDWEVGTRRQVIEKVIIRPRVKLVSK